MFAISVERSRHRLRLFVCSRFVLPRFQRPSAEIFAPSSIRAVHSAHRLAIRVAAHCKRDPAVGTVSNKTAESTTHRSVHPLLSSNKLFCCLFFKTTRLCQLFYQTRTPASEISGSISTTDTAELVCYKVITATSGEKEKTVLIEKNIPFCESAAARNHITRHASNKTYQR